MMCYWLKPVVRHDCQHVFHCLCSILLRLMKSRQKKVWTFCRTLLSITMHNASKCDACKRYNFLLYTSVFFPFLWRFLSWGFYHDCNLPGVCNFILLGCSLSVGGVKLNGVGRQWWKRPRGNLAGCLQNYL